MGESLLLVFTTLFSLGQLACEVITTYTNALILMLLSSPSGMANVT